MRLHRDLRVCPRSLRNGEFHGRYGIDGKALLKLIGPSAAVRIGCSQRIASLLLNAQRSALGGERSLRAVRHSNSFAIPRQRPIQDVVRQLGDRSLHGNGIIGMKDRGQEEADRAHGIDRHCVAGGIASPDGIGHGGRQRVGAGSESGELLLVLIIAHEIVGGGNLITILRGSPYDLQTVCVFNIQEERDALIHVRDSGQVNA